jgi:hypothetical protein
VTTEDIMREFIRVLDKEEAIDEKALSFFLPNILH